MDLEPENRGVKYSSVIYVTEIPNLSRHSSECKIKNVATAYQITKLPSSPPLRDVLLFQIFNFKKYTLGKLISFKE